MLVFSPHIVTSVAPDELYLALFLKVNPWDDEGREVFEQTKLERILWLKQMIKAQQPNLSDEQVDQEIDRRRAIKRQIDEQGLYKLYVEEKPRGKN